MLGILLGPEAKVCPTLNLPLYNVLIERADIDEALSMNAYFASFMLLLFNAVGLAVPASVAAEARMIPELGSTAIPSEASIADPSSFITSAKAALPDHHRRLTRVVRHREIQRQIRQGSGDHGWHGGLLGRRPCRLARPSNGG